MSTGAYSGGRFDDHDGGDGLVTRDFYPQEDFRSEGEETADNDECVDGGQSDNDECVDGGQSDLEAEIGELDVDVAKDGTANLDEDQNGDG